MEKQSDLRQKYVTDWANSDLYSLIPAGNLFLFVRLPVFSSVRRSVNYRTVPECVNYDCAVGGVASVARASREFEDNLMT